MADDVSRALRVTALEQDVDGEKMVSRHVLGQARRNTGDLATIKAPTLVF